LLESFRVSSPESFRAAVSFLIAWLASAKKEFDTAMTASNQTMAA
jgi:hypothetical protein